MSIGNEARSVTSGRADVPLVKTAAVPSLLVIVAGVLLMWLAPTMIRFERRLGLKQSEKSACRRIRWNRIGGFIFVAFGIVGLLKAVLPIEGCARLDLAISGPTITLGLIRLVRFSSRQSPRRS